MPQLQSDEATSLLGFHMGVLKTLKTTGSGEGKDSGIARRDVGVNTVHKGRCIEKRAVSGSHLG